jgi:hypothetical protein
LIVERPVRTIFDALALALFSGLGAAHHTDAADQELALVFYARNPSPAHGLAISTCIGYARWSLRKL